jgi:uncharacterized iron-regulated protein
VDGPAAIQSIADLANVINESALLTARHEKRAITNSYLEEAIDRVIAGPERRTRVMSRRQSLSRGGCRARVDPSAGGSVSYKVLS